MRLLAAVLLLFAANAAAETPQHLKRLPAGVLERGPVPTALAVAREGARVPLWLPGGERSFEVEQVVEAEAAITRFGRIAGLGQGAVTFGRDGGFGRIAQGGTVWLLEYRNGEAFAVRAGEGGLALADYDGDAIAPMAAAAKRAPAAPRPSSSARFSPRTVDFVGLYDTDFAARYPGTLAATRIAHFVALANQAFVDSNVEVTLRMVATVPAPGAVAPSALTNLTDMFNAQQLGSTFAGVDLLSTRTVEGADLITLFRAHDIYEREVCGVAMFPAAAPSAQDFRNGINVVMDGESGGSVCDDYTFAHEVGHNLGARHQLAADPTPARGHAFVRPGQFTTIMGSFGTGQPERQRELGYFSNPRIACGNRPCGSATEDSAGEMSDNAARVSDYVPKKRPGEAARPAAQLADSDGDGFNDRVDAFPFDVARSSDRDGDGVADGDDDFPDNSTEWLDSDGGGFGDNADDDDDNDGVLDVADAFPLDPGESADDDGDGYGNNFDDFDADPLEQRDTDNGSQGDRGDPNDDNDGIVDLVPLLADADGELLVADGATDRILRFRGSDFAPLGTLLQLGANEVTFRSGMVGAPGGEVYFVAASQLRVLDRLRSTSAELMLDTASHPLIGTGFPLSPEISPTGEVVLTEMGSGGKLLALLPAPTRAATPQVTVVQVTPLGSGVQVARANSGDLLVLDGVSGTLDVLDPISLVATGTFPGAAPALASGDIAQGPGGLLYWVDRRDGAVRSLDPVTGVGGGFAIANADAAAITVGPSGVLYVAQRAGGVRAYDGVSGADLGLRVSAASSAQPLSLAWVPTVADTSLPPYTPPPPPTPVADASTTPAIGGAAPPAPPCTTDCVEVGKRGGGVFDPWLSLLFAGFGWRRVRRR